MNELEKLLVVGGILTFILCCSVIPNTVMGYSDELAINDVVSDYNGEPYEVGYNDGYNGTDGGYRIASDYISRCDAGYKYTYSLGYIRGYEDRGW